MKKPLFTLLFVTLSSLSLFAQDSIKAKLPHFIAINTANGSVFKTNDFVSGDNDIPHYMAFALKYGVAARGDSWEDYAYGMPTLGVGLYTADFHREHDLGIPFSLFFFQSAQLRRFNPRWSLNYEWNLGVSFNWKHYDAFDNPDNVALGSTVNVHVGGNVFMNWRMSKKFDLNFGLGYTHFSNGASALPNTGLNMANVFVELAYHFNREDRDVSMINPFTPPPFRKRIDHDVMFLITSREAKVDTTGTGLPSPYNHRKFKVLGLSYAHMFNNTYRYKWGPSIEAVYDESSGATSWREILPETGKSYDRTKLGDVSDRFTLGLSMKGEIAMPAYSVFANLGYNIVHGNKNDERLYQILGVKVHLKDNLFGTFGIRAHNFGKAEYLFWNLGYTISQERKKRKN